MAHKQRGHGVTARRTAASNHKHRGRRKPTYINPVLLGFSVCFVICSIIIFNFRWTLLTYVSNLFPTFRDTDQNNIDHGWRAANTSDELKYGTSVCTIERRRAAELTEVEFEKDFRFKKPVILTFRNGAADWTDPSLWTMDRLRSDHGDAVILSGMAHEIVRRGGSGYRPSTLREYIRDMIVGSNRSSEPLYVFDRNFYDSSFLPSALKPPIYLRLQENIDDSMFFLGSSGSGVSFHKHADGWNGVLYGQKRWFLYPVERTPPGGVFPGYSQQDWFQNIYPSLSANDMPLECIQKAGEIMYLPESMYHSTINLGDTVAVGIQKAEASTVVEKLFYEDQQNIGRLKTEKNDKVKSQLHMRRKEIVEQLIHLLPDNTEVLLKAGRMYRELQDLNQALIYTKRAVQRDPNFILAVLNLADIQGQLGRQEEADTLYQRAVRMNPNLWDVYAQFGDYLVNTGRPNEAVNMYKKGAELQPEMIAFWRRLKIAQERSGDVEGAKQTQAVIDSMKV